MQPIARQIRPDSALDGSAQVGSGGRTWVRLEHGRLMAYDENGDPTVTADTGLPAEARLLAATADLERAAAADAGQLWLRAGAETARIPLAADAVGLLQGGLVLATVPVLEQDATWSSAHRIVLLDHSGAALDEYLVPDAFGAHAAVTVHPGLTQAVVEFAMGQDGTIAVAVQLRPIGDARLRLDVAELLAGQDPVVGGFSPSGDAVLLLPHPNDPSTASVLTWPDLHPLGRHDCTDDPSIEHGIGLTEASSTRPTSSCMPSNRASCSPLETCLGSSMSCWSLRWTGGPTSSGSRRWVRTASPRASGRPVASGERRSGTCTSTDPVGQGVGRRLHFLRIGHGG